MCNRQVAHVIADYEAARLEANEQEAEGQESHDSEQTEEAQPRLLATLRRRLVR